MSSERRDVAISAQGLSKCYKIYRRPTDRLLNVMLPFIDRHDPHWALQNVDFEIERGRALGIIGRNGSGKSTLLQMIAGTLEPTAGSCTVDGKVAALLELGAGFNPEFTGHENIELSAALYGLTASEIAEKYESIVEFSGLSEFVHQPVKTYSSGMFMRLAFSVVAHVDAEILIIDEALAVGDAFFVQKCMRFLREFKKHGTLLIVSHDTGSVMSLCDSAIWLDRGEMAMSGDPKEVCEQYLADRYSEEMGIVKSRSERKPKPVAVVRPDSTEALRSVGEQALSGIWYDDEADSFGTGSAAVSKVRLLDADGSQVELLGGGEEVIVEVTAECFERIEQPLIGFSIKDRLGQHLVGDNTGTWIDHARGDTSVVESGGEVVTRFRFNMPLLLTGEYTVCAAIASGTLENHVQHQWKHDALAFTVHSSSLAGVLVGVPMNDITMTIPERTEEQADLS